MQPRVCVTIGDAMPMGAGEVLAGKYRVDEVLGEGAMGVVVAANHIELNKRVAVKFMKLAALGSAAGKEWIERFMREARAAARLQSEHVCQVFDVGKLDDGAPYLVMELLVGEDLAARLAKVKALPQAVVVNLGIEICEGMAEAHAHGIVHRDLKPQNLFLARSTTGRERIKVLDFGVSKAPTADDMLQTKTTALMGTPVYMSPEQFSSAKEVDARADVWSIGVILYELVAGRRPFGGDSLLDVARSVTETPPRAIDGIDPKLVAVIMKCLAKDREARYVDAAGVARALHELATLATPAPVQVQAPALGMSPGLATTVGKFDAPVLAGLPSGLSTTLGSGSGQNMELPRPRRRHVLWAGVATTVLFVTTLGIVTATRGGDSDGSVEERKPDPPPSLTQPAIQPTQRARPPSEPTPPAPPPPKEEATTETPPPVQVKQKAPPPLAADKTLKKTPPTHVDKSTIRADEAKIKKLEVGQGSGSAGSGSAAVEPECGTLDVECLAERRRKRKTQ